MQALKVNKNISKLLSEDRLARRFVHTYALFHREAASVLLEMGRHLQAERAHPQEVSAGRRGDDAGQDPSPDEEALRSHEGNPRGEVLHQAGGTSSLGRSFIVP